MLQFIAVLSAFYITTLLTARKSITAAVATHLYFVLLALTIACLFKVTPIKKSNLT